MRKARRAAAQRGRRLRIMFADEARFGRMNRPRPCWAPAGTETRPDVYHFHLKTADGDWYNNHHCINPNERHIMGPFVEKNGKIEWIAAQTLTRISYEVPKKYRCDLRC